MKIYKIKDSGFRFRVDPNENLTKYRFKFDKDNILVNSQKLSTTDSIQRSTSSNTDTLTSTDGTSVQITYNPFSLKFMNDGVTYLQVNSENFMFIEDGSEITETRTENFPHGKTAVGIDISFMTSGIRLTGFGENTKSLNLQDTTSERKFIRPEFGYNGYVPLLIGHSSSLKLNPSIFWMNPTDTFYSLKITSDKKVFKIISEGGFIDIVFFIDKISSVITKYEQITGRAPQPPAYAFGYHQNRESYDTIDKINEVLNGYSSNEIPHDTIVINSDKFTDAQITNLKDTLTSQNRYLILQKKPQIKIDANNNIYKEFLDEKIFLQKPQTETTTPETTDPSEPANPSETTEENSLRKLFSFEKSSNGNKNILVYSKKANNFNILEETQNDDIFAVGLNENDKNCSYPDAIKSDYRSLYASKVSNGNYYIQNSQIYVNDQQDFTENKEWLCQNGTVEMRETHSAYNVFFDAAISNSENDDNRNFLSSNVYFSGSQKYVWPIQSQKDFGADSLQIAVNNLITNSLSGLVYTGSDLFIDKSDNELLLRFYQLSLFTFPFVRDNTNSITITQEPYSSGSKD